MSRPYVRQCSTDELKVCGGVRRVLAALGRPLQEPFPQHIQACCAKVGGSQATPPLPG
jgi:hypothetical protein